MSARSFPTLVATSVSEWFLVHSLTLVATPTKPKTQFLLHRRILATCLVTLACAQPAEAAERASDAALAREILADQSLREVHQMAQKL